MSPFFSLLVNAFKGWSQDNASVWCAALSYYTVFSLAPLLLLVVTIAGILFGQKAVEGQLYGQIQGLVGSQGAGLIQNMISHTSKPSTNIITTIIGFVLLALGAAGVFGQLQQALDHVWGVKQSPHAGIWGLIRQRFLSLSMIVVVGFLLIVSLVASAAINLIATFFSGLLPLPSFIVEIINFIVSFVLLTIMFAAVFKVLPDVRLPWKNVWLGAGVTSLLFTIGKTLIGIYIGHGSYTSTYGAASSVVILFVWVYYAAQIIFYGAEFTKAYTLQAEGAVVPSKYGMLEELKPREKIQETLRKRGKDVMYKKKNGKLALAGYAFAGLFYFLLGGLRGKK